MAKKKQQKTYKFAQLRAEAAKRAEGREERPTPEPFVMDDVSPPIIITAPDTLERQLAIAELIDPNGSFSVSQAMPLLRALCGPAFPRVWSLIKDDKNPDTAILLVQQLMGHLFAGLAEAEANKLPGGSEGSSD